MATVIGNPTIVAIRWDNLGSHAGRRQNFPAWLHSINTQLTSYLKQYAVDCAKSTAYYEEAKTSP
jgi:hypothetical protein